MTRNHSVILIAIIGVAVSVGSALTVRWLRKADGTSKFTPVSVLSLGLAVTALVIALMAAIRPEIGDADKKVMRVGDVLICWGSSKASIQPNPRERLLSVSFPQEFAAPPQVIATMHSSDSPGASWNIYDSVVDTKKCTLSLGGISYLLYTGGETYRQGTVTVDWVAVGRAK